jgi:hypothetical protein
VSPRDWFASILWTCVCAFGCVLMFISFKPIAAIIFGVLAIAWIPFTLAMARWASQQKEDDHG